MENFKVGKFTFFRSDSVFWSCSEIPELSICRSEPFGESPVWKAFIKDTFISATSTNPEEACVNALSDNIKRIKSFL